MKKWIAAAYTLCMFLAFGTGLFVNVNPPQMIPVAQAADALEDKKTVDHVDLERYLGDWYEIGTIPMSFQKDCFCTRARYSLADDGKIEVFNTCNKKSVDGKLSEAEGTATIADKTSNAKLRVQFFWPFAGDYWIIGLADDYRYAVISNRKASSLWILSRTPTMSDSDRETALKIATDYGIDISKLKYTEHRDCVYP